MRTKMRTIIALAMLLTASEANAQQRKPYVAMGSGVQTCGVFAEQYRKDPRGVEFMFFAWAQGYMTGANQTISGIQVLKDPKIVPKVRDLGSKSTSEQMDYIRSYCNSHPLALYKDAVDDLFGSLPLSQ